LPHPVEQELPGAEGCNFFSAIYRWSTSLSCCQKLMFYVSCAVFATFVRCHTYAIVLQLTQ